METKSLGEGYFVQPGETGLARKLVAGREGSDGVLGGQSEVMCSCDGYLARVHDCLLQCSSRPQTGDFLSGTYGSVDRLPGTEKANTVILLQDGSSLASARVKCARDGMASLAARARAVQHPERS